jgi:hypothetical protein
VSNAARGNEFAVAAVCGKSSATFEAFSTLDSPCLSMESMRAINRSLTCRLMVMLRPLLTQGPER